MLAQQNRITNSRCPLACLRLANEACLTGAAVKVKVEIRKQQNIKAYIPGHQV